MGEKFDESVQDYDCSAECSPSFSISFMCRSIAFWNKKKRVDPAKFTSEAQNENIPHVVWPGPPEFWPHLANASLYHPFAPCSVEMQKYFLIQKPYRKDRGRQAT